MLIIYQHKATDNSIICKLKHCHYHTD